MYIFSVFFAETAELCVIRRHWNQRAMALSALSRNR